jgi:hypothetical protein
MNIDIVQLEKLLKAQKFDEARTLIEAFFSGKPTSEQKGEMFVNYASMHLELMNRIDAEYIKALEEIVKDLEIVKEEGKEEGKKLEEKIDLHKIRSELSE